MKYEYGLLYPPDEQGKYRKRAMIEVQLQGPNGTFRELALVDSGADRSLVHREIADVLGLDYQQGRRHQVIVGDHRAESVSCQLSQRSHHPDAFSPHQWVLTSRIGTPFALLQLLVFLPQEPFMHARTQRRFEDRDSQRAFALLDGPIGQDDNPFPLPCAHVPG
jgi:hypothetical protein